MSTITTAQIRKYLKKTGSNFVMPLMWSAERVLALLAESEKIDVAQLAEKIAQANAPQIFPPSEPGRRRDKGDLCDAVKKLGCTVSWVEGAADAKRFGWEHPAYRCDDMWEDAEDCAEAFMRQLMGELAYELDFVPVPRDDLFEFKSALTMAAFHPTLTSSVQRAEKAMNRAHELLG